MTKETGFPFEIPILFKKVGGGGGGGKGHLLEGRAE